MRTCIMVSALGWMFIWGAASASGQNNAPTTVQLPTFSFFTVQTAVSVPDSGGAHLGGISRSYQSSSRRGLPFWAKTPWLSPLGGSRGIASGASAGGVSVHATIIDHEELDRAVLAEAAARSRPPSEIDLKAGDLTRNARTRDGVNRTPDSIAAIRAAQAAEDRAQEEQAAALFTKALELEAAHKSGQARIYYRMASRHANEQLRQQIAERLAALK